MPVSATAVDLGLLILRLALGGVFLAQAANHIWGGGKITGTARWFSSLGMRPGIVGTMLVAWITNHLRNGFFIFRPGEGWEYVATLTVLGLVLATLGPGGWSVDAQVGVLRDLWGWPGLLVAAVGGGAGAALLLGVFWRPARNLADR